MSRTEKLILAGTLMLSLALMGIGAFAQDEDNQGQQGDEATGLPNIVQPFENALNRLEEFSAGNFRHHDFEGANLPESLAINPEGHSRITSGQVTSIGAASLGIKVWGLSFTVNASSDTQIVLGSQGGAQLSGIQVGDTLDVVGTTNENAPGVINAEVIHDRTAAVRAQQDRINNLRNQIQALIQRLQAILSQTGQPLPPGFSPLPSPSATPELTPSPSPAPSPSPTPTPSH